jgi:hypothetical protein
MAAVPDVTTQMIAYYTEGNHGLLPTRWRDQLAEIRALPPRQRGPSSRGSDGTVTLRHVFISAVWRALAPFRSRGR